MILTELIFNNLNFMKQRLVSVILFLLLLSILTWFYFINSNNYKSLGELKYSIINHPEFLPKKDIAKYTSFWFANLRADIYWLETIQYIGWNAIWSEYKKYLYSMLDLITQLNPYFEKPYIIWQLLLPAYNERYEKLSLEEQNENIKQSELIWLKWIKNFCDETKINLIKKENDLNKIWSEEKYKNPCKTSNIAFGQAFLYYFYLKNPLESANYYKIASANDDSLEWSKIMAAIMNWKGWDREKSIMMFLTLAKSQKQTEVCSIFAEELEKISFAIYRQQAELDSEIIKEIEKLRNEHFVFNEEAEKEIISWDNCNNYINKAIRELNLQYIENANKAYFKDHQENAKNAKILFDKWYIDFLPTDFQQYDDYWIIYTFNQETWNFDYEMWNY